MGLEIQGKLINVKPIQEVSASFSKREIVIEIEGQYPQEVQLELHQTSVDLIDSYQIGDNLKVSFNLRGKRYEKEGEETKWFNTLQAWRIEKTQ